MNEWTTAAECWWFAWCSRWSPHSLSCGFSRRRWPVTLVMLTLSPIKMETGKQSIDLPTSWNKSSSYPNRGFFIYSLNKGISLVLSECLQIFTFKYNYHLQEVSRPGQHEVIWFPVSKSLFFVLFCFAFPDLGARGRTGHTPFSYAIRNLSLRRHAKLQRKLGGQQWQTLILSYIKVYSRACKGLKFQKQSCNH